MLELAGPSVDCCPGVIAPQLLGVVPSLGQGSDQTREVVEDHDFQHVGSLSDDWLLLSSHPCEMRHAR